MLSKSNLKVQVKYVLYSFGHAFQKFVSQTLMKRFVLSHIFRTLSQAGASM